MREKNVSLANVETKCFAIGCKGSRRHVMRRFLAFFYLFGPMRHVMDAAFRYCWWQVESVKWIHEKYWYNIHFNWEKEIIRREYHQSCAQPGFRAEKKGAVSGHFLFIFLCLGAKKGRNKTRAQPWYARKSGKSPGQNHTPPCFSEELAFAKRHAKPKSLLWAWRAFRRPVKFSMSFSLCWSCALLNFLLGAGSELMVIWKGWFETAPCRATLATPFSALDPRILGTRFTNYGLRMFWGKVMVIWKGWIETVPCRATLNTPSSALVQKFSENGLQITVCKSPVVAGLASQKIEFAIAAFSNRKLIQNRHSESLTAEKSQKNRRLKTRKGGEHRGGGGFRNLLRKKMGS